MALDTALIDWVTEALEPVGAVSMRHMMGGATLYCDAIVFAIVAADAMWFKADVKSDALWDAEGCGRFTFTMGEGRTGSMNYRSAPQDVYDDAEAMRRWAQPAIEAGRRAPVRKKRPVAR